MKVIVAIDSFKGCLTAGEACVAAARGVERAFAGAQLVCLPMSDGGDGMLEAFSIAWGASMVTARVHDPLMRPIETHYGITADGQTAIIEMACASGLSLLSSHERNPMVATSYGTGELVADAERRGCSRLIIGLGGSATVDGGRGMLRALGISIDDDGIDVSGSLLAGRELELIIASDVTNPLCGPLGAASVFGLQKGATPAMVEQLEQQLRQFARQTAAVVGEDYSVCPGAGAAGGLGFALMAYMKGKMRSGAELLLEQYHFDRLLADASLVITGEGSADRQTLMGKLPQAILRHASAQSVPTVLIAGQVADRTTLLEAGFAAVECVNPPDMPLSHCLQPAVARLNIATTAARLAHLAR